MSSRIQDRPTCSNISLVPGSTRMIAPLQTQQQLLSEEDLSEDSDGCDSDLEQQEGQAFAAGESDDWMFSALNNCNPAVHRSGQLINVRINAEESSNRNIRVVSSKKPVLVFIVDVTCQRVKPDRSWNSSSRVFQAAGLVLTTISSTQL